MLYFSRPRNFTEQSVKMNRHLHQTNHDQEQKNNQQSINLINRTHHSLWATQSNSQKKIRQQRNQASNDFFFEYE